MTFGEKKNYGKYCEKTSWWFGADTRTKILDTGASENHTANLVLEFNEFFGGFQIFIDCNYRAIPNAKPLDSGERILFTFLERNPHQMVYFQSFKNTPLLLLKVNNGFLAWNSSFLIQFRILQGTPGFRSHASKIMWVSSVQQWVKKNEFFRFFFCHFWPKYTIMWVALKVIALLRGGGCSKIMWVLSTVTQWSFLVKDGLKFDFSQTVWPIGLKFYLKHIEE